MDLDRLLPHIHRKGRKRLRMNDGVDAGLVDFAGARSFFNLNQLGPSAGI
jgi:hypothetical protein